MQVFPFFCLPPHTSPSVPISIAAPVRLPPTAVRRAGTTPPASTPRVTFPIPPPASTWLPSTSPRQRAERSPTSLALTYWSYRSQGAPKPRQFPGRASIGRVPGSFVQEVCYGPG